MLVRALGLDPVRTLKSVDHCTTKYRWLGPADAQSPAARSQLIGALAQDPNRETRGRVKRLGCAGVVAQITWRQRQELARNPSQLFAGHRLESHSVGRKLIGRFHGECPIHPRMTVWERALTVL